VKEPFSTVLPVLKWLPRYQGAWFARDLLAGVTLAAYAIPVSLAYASLAGLPPEHGVYCYFAAGLAYPWLGTSRQLAIGPTSAIAMLVGATIAPLAGGDPARAVGIVGLTALLVAVLSGLAWLLRLSGLVCFISETILTGFKAGAALTIALTQLPKLFGVPGGGDHFFERVWVLTGQLDQTNLIVLSLGVAALATLLWVEYAFPGRSAALPVVVVATLLVSCLGLAEHGVSTVGSLPAGLPTFGWPTIRWRDVDGLLPLAAACFLLSYVESISAARALAARHGYEVDSRQELLGLGAANLLTGFCQGFPVAGGLSQSSVNDQAGAQTPLSLLWASLTMGLCLLWLTGLLSDLPNVVLAAIVLVAVKGLVDGPALRRLWKVSRSEFMIALVALFGVLLLGILQGVLLAVIASLLALLSAAAQPHVAVLGRIPGTRRYSDADRHPENVVVPGLLIMRVESSLLYFNCEHVRNLMGQRAAATAGLEQLILDLSNAPRVDVAATEMLRALSRDLAARDVRLRLVEAHASVRDLLRAAESETEVGLLDRRDSLDQVVSEFEARDQAATDQAATEPSTPPFREEI